LAGHWAVSSAAMRAAMKVVRWGAQRAGYSVARWVERRAGNLVGE